MLILELGEKVVKICSACLSKTNPAIERLDVFEFVDGAVSAELKALILKLSKEKYEKIIVSIPRLLFLMRFLELPSSDREEIQKMLPFQLAKIVPYPVNEVLYDYSFVEAKEGASKSILFLIQEKKIAGLFEIIKGSKMHVFAVTMTTWGIFKWFDFQKRFLGEEIDYPLAVIDIDRYSADFVVLGENKVVFSRSFLYGEERELLEGITQSVKIYESGFAPGKFSKLIFSGNEKKFVLDRFSRDRVLFINQEDNFSFAGAGQERIPPGGFSFVSLLGLMLEPGVPYFDFSPQYIKDKRRFSQKKRRYLEISFIAAQAIIIVAIFFCKYIFDRYSYLEFLDKELNRIKIETEEIDGIADKLKVLNRQAGRKSSFSDILYNIVSSIPPNTQLTLLDFQENGFFSLKGYVSDVAVVFDFATELNKRKVLKEVKVQHASKMKAKDKAMVEFLIVGRR
ncbi:MAG: pilus assembly protein PilM [Candidatus Omnitrophota bacterium]